MAELTELSVFTAPSYELRDTDTLKDLMDSCINVRLADPVTQEYHVKPVACLKHPDVPYLLNVYFGQFRPDGRSRTSASLRIDEPFMLMAIAVNENNDLIGEIKPMKVTPDMHQEVMNQIRFAYYNLPGLVVKYPESQWTIKNPKA